MTIRNHGAYLSEYAAQLPVLGQAGQERLHNSRVVLAGTGRLGSMLALILEAAGVGHIAAADGQTVQWDNGNSGIFRVPQDLGKPKVLVLHERLRRRESVSFRPFPVPIQSADIDSEICNSDLSICCANTVAGRLAAEEKAIRFNKPSMQVAAYDGAERLGGLITLWLRENSCFGCYVEETTEPARGEGLLATVTSTLAAIAANMAVQLLTGIRADAVRAQNLFFVDLEDYTIVPHKVQKKKGCAVCGGM